MGWTWYNATEWNGSKINRKAECDKQFTYANSPYEVLKSSMVGTTYYAAIKKGDIVFAVIFLTSTDRWEFGYKDMDETMGPYRYDCPVSILKLLTETDNEEANLWRQHCRENIERKKKQIKLGSLPVGTIIEASCPCDCSSNNKGDKITLRKVNDYGRVYWTDGHYRWTRPLMAMIQEQGFKIIKEGN